MCDSDLRIKKIFDPEKEVFITGFSKLFFVLDLLEYRNPFMRLSHTLNEEVNRHCSGIKNSMKMEMEEALEKGFKPCKRCYK